MIALFANSFKSGKANESEFIVGIKLGRENVGPIGPFIGNDMRKTFIFIEIILFVISVKVDLG